jgi:hypothetical protein
MDISNGPAAPESGSEIPTFAELEADPEIAALLDFEPVPRKSSPPNGWTPEAQRKFIAYFAFTGAQGKACGFIGKDRGGAKKLYDSPEGGSFRASWHAALDLYKRRWEEKYGDGPPPERTPPTVDGRWKATDRHSAPLPPEGQMLNELGEWEDEESVHRRAEEARDSVAGKLVRCRRLYLHEISGSPGKRAAFEILTELPVDWDRAERLEPQPFEPWTRVNQHQPDMVLTAESGWSFGDCGYGPDRMAQARRALDEHLAEEGLPPVDWSGETNE